MFMDRPVPVPWYVRLRVRRGALLLDRKSRGWWQKIDVKKLDVASGRECVLGQVYGDWSFGLDELRIRGTSEKYGFASYSDRYPELNQAWTRLVSGRCK